MPTTREIKRESRAVVQFRVGLEGTPSEKLQIMGYAFDNVGNFLDSRQVEKGQVELALGNGQAARARIFFGPPLEELRREESPTIELMKQVQAYEPVWKLDPEKQIQEIMPIPEPHWKEWLICGCRIRGQLVRAVAHSGGIMELPVCHARVHICEVDRLPLVLRYLPEPLIERLRDELLRELLRPLPHPEPTPDPPPFERDPGFIDPSPENIARRAERLPAPASHLSHATSFAAPRATEFPALPAETLAALRSTSIPLVRQVLIDHSRLIYPYLCRWPWFWHRYRCDEIAVVETDAQGRFDIPYWHLCTPDKPDLYFWVEYLIDGVWTTVHRPSVACSTHWDYACGEEVTIRLTDPRVPVCDTASDPVGLTVAVMGIGMQVSVPEIQGQAAGAKQGLTTTGAPFGGILEPRVQFGRQALFAAGITHYRWSYRRLTLGDGVTPAAAATPQYLDQTVVRHYMVMAADGGLSFPAEVMGPDPAFPGKDLFKIQPITPPAGSMGWAVVDDHQDLATAFFPTHLLGGGDPAAVAGKYELILELFRADGTRANLTDEGVELKIPDVPAPFGAGTVTTVDAPPEHLLVEAGKVVGFRMVVHVDNNVCSGHIFDVSVNGAEAGECGFLEYTEGTAASTMADLSFRASHPHNFATFEFRVERGSSPPVGPASASGQVGVSQNGFAHGGGIYSKQLSVQTLLDTPPMAPPCTQAAFAERLRVYAMATDGWNRLSYLDAPRPGEDGLKAFALAPG